MISKSTKGKYGLAFVGKSKTVASAQAECDINNILAKYKKTGLIEHARQHVGHYGDFTGIQDYQTSLNQVMAAQAMFMSLPASLRSRFSNDPGQFLDFVINPANEAELIKLGLANPKPAPSNTAPPMADKQGDPSTKV